MNEIIQDQNQATETSSSPEVNSTQPQIAEAQPTPLYTRGTQGISPEPAQEPVPIKQPKAKSFSGPCQTSVDERIEFINKRLIKIISRLDLLERHSHDQNGQPSVTLKSVRDCSY